MNHHSVQHLCSDTSFADTPPTAAWLLLRLFSYLHWWNSKWSLESVQSHHLILPSGPISFFIDRKHFVLWSAIIHDDTEWHSYTICSHIKAPAFYPENAVLCINRRRKCLVFWWKLPGSTISLHLQMHIRSYSHSSVQVTSIRGFVG